MNCLPLQVLGLQVFLHHFGLLGSGEQTENAMNVLLASKQAFYHLGSIFMPKGGILGVCSKELCIQLFSCFRYPGFFFFVKGSSPCLRSKSTRQSQEHLSIQLGRGAALPSVPLPLLPSADPSPQAFADQSPPKRYRNCSCSSRALSHFPVLLTFRNNKSSGHC